MIRADLGRFCLVPCLITLAVLIAMGLQEFLGIQTDIVGKLILQDPTRMGNLDFNDARFNVLGFYRGSTGMLATLSAACAFGLGPSAFGGTVGFALSLLISCAVILLCGSKTSLVVFTALLIISSVERKHIVLLVLVISASTLFSLIRAGDIEIPEVLPVSLRQFLETGGERRDTLGARQEFWSLLGASLDEHPELLFGLPDPRRSVLIAEGGAHNEYLSILADGGIVALFLYLVTYLSIFRSSLRNKDPVKRHVGLYVLAGGAIQASTMNHLLAGLLYAPVVFCTVFIYSICISATRKPQNLGSVIVKGIDTSKRAIAV